MLSFKGISRTVWVLSVVSLLTDAASEMLYPIMPIYLQSIGFSVVLMGVLEGVAEATAGLSKGYFGSLSDQFERRAPFVQIGYACSAFSKPLLAMMTYPVWIFFARTLDRFGKGIRTAARDALLSDESTPQTKGRVFGFHRSMDTLGAVIGPLLALLYLSFFPQHYKALFYYAVIPGLMAVIASFFLKEKKIQINQTTTSTSFFSFLQYWKKSPIVYRKLVVGLVVFTLFNSSDVFLLLRAKDTGLNDTFVIGLYIFYNLVFALFAFPIGVLADKLGLKKIFVVGLVLFAFVYAGMSLHGGFYFYVFLFFLYGLYAAATDGISKAWITNITEKEFKATAIGTFSAFQSIAALIASSLTGLIWFIWGAETAFLTTVLATIIVIVYFIISIPNTRH
ncbi:MAG: MFS transporter [Bacteroidetes bacterium]|nr:MFS transporter [Bacteroidota bacterium]